MKTNAEYIAMAKEKHMQFVGAERAAVCELLDACRRCSCYLLVDDGTHKRVKGSLRLTPLDRPVFLRERTQDWVIPYFFWQSFHTASSSRRPIS